MNANELADNQLTHVIGENNNGEEVVITLRKPLYPESFVRQQQAEIEALKAAKIRAYNNGVEDGRKPNTNLVKELTDDKIAELIKATNDEIGMKNIRTFDFTKVLLRKAQEK